MTAIVNYGKITGELLRQGALLVDVVSGGHDQSSNA